MYAGEIPVGKQLCVHSCMFFFFQAEDGIRDLTVTGVQTCALPIYGIRSNGKLVPLKASKDDPYANNGGMVGRHHGLSILTLLLDNIKVTKDQGDEAEDRKSVV